MKRHTGRLSGRSVDHLGKRCVRRGGGEGMMPVSAAGDWPRASLSRYPLTASEPTPTFSRSSIHDSVAIRHPTLSPHKLIRSSFEQANIQGPLPTVRSQYAFIRCEASSQAQDDCPTNVPPQRRPARKYSMNYLWTSNQPTIPSQTSAVLLPSSACTMRALLGQNPSRPPCPFRASLFLSLAPLPRALNFLSVARLSLAAHSAALLGLSVTWGPYCPVKARPTLRFSPAPTLCPERTRPNMSSRYLRHIRHPFRRTALFLHTRSPFYHLPTLFQLLLSGHFDCCRPKLAPAVLQRR
ncbi:hypothetical protein C8Q74DRAFT_702304 [Fomes fomentarius]|nr:hypothetical protein C8Q74DRAFT_702304 [Fomes fomentarius]